MRVASIITIGMIFTACSSNNETERYARLVEQWQGRVIEFPSVMVDVATGDTLDLSDADFTILTYIDSTGCTGCRMKLPLWREFLGSIDSIAREREVNSVIVVNTKNEDELSYLIRRDAYDYPIVNDLTDSLNLLNEFPDDTAFRTLLLDNNKRVIAIGNPTTNNAIAGLYRSIISGSKTFSSSGHQVVTAIPSKISLGEIPIGKELSADFFIENQGRDTVYIRNIITSCPCTEASVAGTNIPPGQKVPVSVNLREDSLIGDFQRTVHIFYQNFENPTILGISGRVI